MADHDTRELLFVYGALRRGASNARRMRGARFRGTARIAGTLIRVDWYPGLILDGDRNVVGELYEVTPRQLAELDAFEGIGDVLERRGQYERVRATVNTAAGECRAWVYAWQLGQEGYPLVESGDWLQVDLDE